MISPKMYEARKVCNLILLEFDAVTYNITNAKLNKVLYYVQGFYLVRFKAPLIRNHFESWDYGPVIRSVYDAFKVFGQMPITQLATYRDYTDNTEKPVPCDDLSETDRRFVLSVADTYLRHSVGSLIRETHVPNGPWDRARRADRGVRRSRRIPNEEIASYFNDEFGGERLH